MTLFAVSAYAQVTTSTIAGKVSDAQGTVAGAPVVATYIPTGAVYYSVTDNNGNYRINNVTPGGPYTVTVEMLGYAKAEIKGITAPLADVIEIDAKLQDESIALDAAVLTSDASDAGMNIRRSGAGTAVSQKTLSNLPTVSRSLNDVLALTPQASSTTSGIAVGGGNYRGSSVTVDGAAFNNAFGIGSNLPAGGSPISIDAIEQMSINITPFDVRQSGFTGGSINAVTKSGSNEFKASVYNYYTSQDTRGYKVGDAEVANNDMLNNTVGFTVGGPIIKDKLFFFVNGEYSFDTVPGSSTEARPDASAEWGDGKNYNRPTVAQMDEMKAYVGDKFGYNPGRYQGFSLETPDYKVLARIDWLINDNNKLNVRFSHTHNYYSSSPSSSMSPIGGTNSSYVYNGTDVKFNRYSAGRQSTFAMPYEAARYYQEQNFTSIAAELNSRLFDGNGNNMFRVSYSHQNEPRSFVGDLFPTVDILSKEGVTGSDTDAILTTIGVDPFTYGNLREVAIVTATDEFTYHVGINNFIAGLSYEWNRSKNGYMQGGAGWYIYDSFDSFKQDVENPSASTGPVAFMITHANLDDPTQQVFPSFDYSQFSAYVQDEIAISDYFKLTAGLRLELPLISIPTDNNNKAFAEIAKANPGTSFEGLSTADVPAARVSVSPRLGFNWDVLKDRSLIVRGGTGIYTGRIPNVWLVSAIGNGNCLQYQGIYKDVMSDGTNKYGIHFHQDRKDVINQLYGTTPFEKQDLAAPSSTTIISKDLKMPSSWKSSLAIDAKLPGGIKATLEGVFSKNYNEVYAYGLNWKKDGEVTLPGEPAAREKWVSEGISGGKVGGYLLKNTDLSGHYYSVTAQLSKSFDFGLDLSAAYTRSGATSLSDGNGDQVSEFANTYTLNGSVSPCLGNAFYVAPNRVIANALYTIKEGNRTATKISAFYEGLNIGYISSYSYSRVSYLMNNVSGGVNNASQLIYIPTDAELESMPFADAENKAAYADFLASDKYTSKHRGEYSVRNGAKAPWLNRLNIRAAQDIYFDVAGRTQTLELGVDIKNVGNLINSDWGVYKVMSSNTILNFDGANYTFTAPEWNNFKDLSSTWQILFSAKWFF
ncbi:MAG: TonB-dependent receptor [Bacteroidales bacterium]|nr:TonB-dependent receptor [Candidatus Cryptobacteroides aphodequi]